MTLNIGVMMKNLIENILDLAKLKEGGLCGYPVRSSKD